MNTPTNFDPNVLNNIETILTATNDPAFNAAYIDRLESSTVLNPELAQLARDLFLKGTPYTQTATERTNESNQFILTFDNGMENWHTKYGLNLQNALNDFDYLSRQDATSHTTYPATVEILFNDIVIRSYGN